MATHKVRHLPLATIAAIGFALAVGSAPVLAMFALQSAFEAAELRQ